MDLLEAYPTLRLVPEALAQELRSAVVPASAAAGRTVFEPDVFGERYPFVLEGVARVVKTEREGKENLFYRLRPGDHCLLSAVGLLARWRFGARVVAETELRALLIDGRLFRALVHAAPEFAHSVFIGIARHIEILMDLVEQSRRFRLDQRVAAMLLARGPEVAASHQELADDISASRENVSRVLEVFQEHRWVRLGRRRIEIVDPSALERLLD